MQNNQKILRVYQSSDYLWVLAFILRPHDRMICPCWMVAHGSIHYFIIIPKGMFSQENKGHAGNVCLHAHTKLIQID